MAYQGVEQLNAAGTREESGPPYVVEMGGGGGLRTLSQALRPKVGERLTALVGVWDSGGGTGDIRKEYGGLAVGDLRNVAGVMSKLGEDALLGLSGKFGKGTGESTLNVENQAPGNLILANLFQLFPNDPERVIAAYSDLYQIEGKVLPVTHENLQLHLTTPSGVKLIGEHAIDDIDEEEAQKYPELRNLKGSELSFDKKATLSVAGRAALMGCDFVVTGLGDFYTSVGPHARVEGVTEILMRKPVFWVVNLMNGPNQTYDWSAADYLEQLKLQNGGVNVVDRVIYNNQPLDPEALEIQLAKGSAPVKVDEEELRDLGYDVVGYGLASNKKVKRDPNDKVRNRAEIIHDDNVLGRVIMREWFSNGFRPKG